MGTCIVGMTVQWCTCTYVGVVLLSVFHWHFCVQCLCGILQIIVILTCQWVEVTWPCMLVRRGPFPTVGLILSVVSRACFKAAEYRYIVYIHVTGSEKANHCNFTVQA